MKKFLLSTAFLLFISTNYAHADSNQDHTCQGGNNTCGETINYNNNTTNQGGTGGTGIGVGIGQGGQGGNGGNGGNATGGTATATGGNATGGNAVQGQIQGQSQTGIGSGNSTNVNTSVDASESNKYPVSSSYAPALGSAPAAYCTRTDGASMGVQTFGFGISGGAYHQYDDVFCQRLTLWQNLMIAPSNYQVDGVTAPILAGYVIMQDPIIAQALQDAKSGKTIQMGVPSGEVKQEPMIYETDGGASAQKTEWEPIGGSNR